MKVQELIDMLEEFDGDEEVVFAYGYGDYWRNTVAAKPRRVEREPCEYSDYHQMLKVIDRDDDRDFEEDEHGNFVDTRNLNEYVVIS